MRFLIDQIREQKILEMEVNLDDFLKKYNISEQSMIHTITFDKDVFEKEIEVREYLKDKAMWEPNISEIEGLWIAQLVPSAQIDIETEIEVDLRRGVIAMAAELLPVMNFEEFQFNDKGEVNLSSKFGTINLHEGLPHIIEIARVAEGDHPTYGKLKITQEHLQSMVINFKSNAAGVDLAVNEDHRKNEAFGWFKDVFLSFDKQTLYGQVQWNTKGIQALSEKEYRYFSPEFRFNYTHPHTGVEYGPTLLGGALTNYPFLKMDAITELSNKQTGESTVSTPTIDLSVHNEKVVELSAKVAEVQTKLNETEALNIELSAKLKEVEAKMEKEAKEKVHGALFAEGKINKAQLVALNEGKSMLDVLSLAAKMNLEAVGTDEVAAPTVELSSKEKEFAKNLGLTDEEYAKYNNIK